MIIEKINNNKIKIEFSLDELEKYNISIHSFLSSSIDSQKFINSLLDIAKDEFNFNKENNPFILETISFNNNKFTIFATISINKYQIKNCIILQFENYNDLIHFSNYIKNSIPLFNLSNSLYKYNNHFYLKISFKTLTMTERTSYFYFISEYLNNINLSELCIDLLLEYSELIIEHNAIEKLSHL